MFAMSSFYSVLLNQQTWQSQVKEGLKATHTSLSSQTHPLRQMAQGPRSDPELFAKKCFPM